MTIAEPEFSEHYQAIYRERMRGLPIVNDRLDVETVGFRDFEGHRLGILVTPWFMNLVLLPGTDDYAEVAQGSTIAWSLPGGSYEFTACRDDGLGVYFTAVLFRTVTDIPDQPMARRIAEEIMRELFREQAETAAKTGTMSRRALLAGRGAS